MVSSALWLLLARSAPTLNYSWSHPRGQISGSCSRTSSRRSRDVQPNYVLQRTPGTFYVLTYHRGPAPLNTALGLMHPPYRVIHSYVHQERIGVLVELAAETDFATRSVEFKQFAHDIALHLAAANPATLAELLEQPFVKDSALTVGQLLSDLGATFRERVAIVRFVRWDTDSPLARDPEPPNAPAVARRA